MKRCRRCGEYKGGEAFARNKRKADGLNDRCRECFREIYELDREARLAKMAVRRSVARGAARQWVAEYLRTHECVDCGTSDLRCLEFDHRQDEVKRWEISRMVGGAYNVEAIAGEVAKCDVRCTNCHRRVTEERRNSVRHRAELERRAERRAVALARLEVLSAPGR